MNGCLDGCFIEKIDTFSDRFKSLVPSEKSVKSFVELLMIATAILTLALL